MKPRLNLFLAALALTASGRATEFHVAPDGNDANRGTKTAPLRTIQRAADLAQPGDVVTVHAGTYREQVNPPRGGSSNHRRIVYQAAPGERVEIRGSEVVKGWTRVSNDVWKVTLPNEFFGAFNPYRDLIRGDWFDRRGRDHHTGAVYLNGDWLTEAAKLEEVLLPPGTSPSWLKHGAREFIFNLASFRLGSGSGAGKAIPATSLTARQGTTNAPCSEGGECVGWIAPGDWVRYDGVEFGEGVAEMEFRCASEAAGGLIEIRLDGPQGALLGTCQVPNTGDWQAWTNLKTPLQPARGVKSLCLVFKASRPPALNPQLWFAQVDDTHTTLWAQFNGADPNEQLVEVNARRTVFYPDQPGRNFITVRGFILRHAATPWAPPTAEQIGLLGTHWSKGWLIESNVISHSTCSGIALGKHGDEFDNTSANTAEGYVKTIERAHAFRIPWTRDHIGHHVVRGNTISHCEQAGIVGSLGAAFSTVTGNVIHDIHVRRLFSGAEMAGIKFHAAIDTVIRGNHIHHTCLGLWLDWMAQGTRVSGNLFHDNAGQDLFVEVNHGPFVVDNNLFLSGTSLLDMSQGGAYAHNLFAGKIVSTEEPSRQTPYHPAHSTTVAGLRAIQGGDNRCYNNVFVGRGDKPLEGPKPNDRHRRVSGAGLGVYDLREWPLQTGGNVYFYGARPYAKETNHVVLPDLDPQVKLLEQEGQLLLRFAPGRGLELAPTASLTTRLLGKTSIAGLPYRDANGSRLKLNTDYLGKKRSRSRPTPGPLENPGTGLLPLKAKATS